VPGERDRAAVVAAASTEASAEGPAPGLEALHALWPAVVDVVRAENALLGALIAEARPVAADGEDLTLAFAATAQFLKKKAEDPANRLPVGEALRAVTGTAWRLSYELREVDAPGSAERAAGGTQEDWVRRFMEEFDAEELDGDAESEAGGRALSSNEKGS
jgi:hypothetical protein